MQFEFATAGRIIFGVGALAKAGPLAAEMGSRALITSGLPEPALAPLLQVLEQARVAYSVLPVTGEPTISSVQDGAAMARRGGCHLLIGIGGGSAIDTGKAIAAVLTNPGDLLDYLEVVGRGHALKFAPAPFIAIPTTAGTGAEVTRNAVLGVPEKRLKVSLRSPLMLPRAAIVDPAMTYSLPPAVTASTGMDALTQLIEPFVSRQANPLVDALCREGIPRSSRSLARAYHDGQDSQAREDLCLASLFGGLALANAKLGAVHGFASPIGGMFPAPHGAVCARLLPLVMETNIQALRERQPDSLVLLRYAEVARLLTGVAEAQPMDGARWVAQRCEELGIPGLSAFGVIPSDIPQLVQEGARASSMAGNPLPLSPEEMTAILQRAL